MRTFGIRTALAAAAAFSCAACFAQTQQCNSIQTVVGSGRNADYRTAVYEALVQAASQVQGVSLQDSRDAFMDSTAQLRKSKTDNADVSEVRESLKQTVSAKTKGRVLSYRVTGEKYITEMGLWFIELEAKVPGQYTVGLPEGNRRRMIAMPFDSLTSTVEVLGRTVKLGASCESIARRLNERLSQTRRFTMLDRAFDAKVKAGIVVPIYKTTKKDGKEIEEPCKPDDIPNDKLDAVVNEIQSEAQADKFVEASAKESVRAKGMNRKNAIAKELKDREDNK